MNSATTAPPCNAARHLQGFLLHTANLYLMYFEREWVFDRASQQYKERSPGGGYVAFRRGVTEATIRALLQQLNNACYIIRSLVRPFLSLHHHSPHLQYHSRFDLRFQHRL